MEIIPPETHRLLIKYTPGGRSFEACVDGRTNRWRIDPDYSVPPVRHDLEQEIQMLVELHMENYGRVPAYEPDAATGSPARACVLIYPGTQWLSWPATPRSIQGRIY